MSIAGLINMSMLIIAASTFHDQGLVDVGDDLTQVSDDTRHVSRLERRSAVRCGAARLGSLVVEYRDDGRAGRHAGFIGRRIPLFVRRLVTMLPALIVVAVGVDPSRALVLSQVVLSFGIPFALIPLIVFCRDRSLMGSLVNRRVTTVAGVAVATVIIALNAFLLAGTFGVVGV